MGRVSTQLSQAVSSAAGAAPELPPRQSGQARATPRERLSMIFFNFALEMTFCVEIDRNVS